MDDETIRLILDMGQSGATVEQITQKLVALQAAASKVGDEYQILDRQVGTYIVATDKLTHELDEQVRKSVEATMAQKAMAQILDEMGSHAAVASAGMHQIIGKPGGHGNAGQGLVGASYAAQDFITVLSGGGGLGRAMMSAANNITPVALALGAGAGLAGVVGLVVTGISAAIPLVEKWWGAVDSEKAEAAKKKLQEVRAELEKIHAEFKKLEEKPTDYEAMAAEGIKGFLGERGNAAKARAAVAGSVTGKEAWESIAPDQQKQYRGLEAEATATDEDIAKAAYEEAAMRPGNAEAPPWVIQQQAQQIAATKREARATAQRKRAEIMRGGRTAAAEKIVTGATVAGPAGDAARKQLLGVAAGTPGLTELGYYTAERIKADEEAADRDDEKERDELDRWHAAKARAKARDEGFRKRTAAADKVEAELARDAKKEAADIHADRQFGRKIGTAAAKGAAAGLPKDALGKLPLIKEGSAEELDRAMIANQEQMTANLKALQDLAQRAGRVGQENRRISRQRQQPMANYGW